ncbi:MAG TPA: hypothetical protein VF074_16830, partial [Pyrinomonadaceae bacterium]
FNMAASLDLFWIFSQAEILRMDHSRCPFLATRSLKMRFSLELEGLASLKVGTTTFEPDPPEPAYMVLSL